MRAVPEHRRHRHVHERRLRHHVQRRLSQLQRGLLVGHQPGELRYFVHALYRANQRYRDLHERHLRRDLQHGLPRLLG